MPTAETPPPDAAAILRARLIGHLQSTHALKAGALRMFDPMLAAVAAQRDDGALAEVNDLLTRMLDAFGRHRE
ncbi:MAG: hypothetical protein H0T43_07085, partial [Solirubrobacterales bacterium]|nr:hypothetical protein [Solirubrobacterales bacterium]